MEHLHLGVALVAEPAPREDNAGMGSCVQPRAVKGKDGHVTVIPALVRNSYADQQKWPCFTLSRF